MTPSTLVFEYISSTSAIENTPPLAIMGTEADSFTNRIASRLAGSVFFCVFVLPWTVMYSTPTDSARLTNSYVSLFEGKGAVSDTALHYPTCFKKRLLFLLQVWVNTNLDAAGYVESTFDGSDHIPNGFWLRHQMSTDLFMNSPFLRTSTIDILEEFNF